MRENAAREVPLIRRRFASTPSAASGSRSARLAIGVGFRSRCRAETLVALVEEAFLQIVRLHPEHAADPALLTTIAQKDDPPLRGAATLLGLPILLLPKSALVGTEDRITVASDHVRARHGIPSVAEAAALVAAGPDARLLVPRMATADATCAIAARGEP